MTGAGDELGALVAAIQRCRRCEAAGHLAAAQPRLLGLSRRLPGLPAACRWPRLVVIGQAPGPRHDPAAEPFSSAYGRAIAGWLARAGFPAAELAARVHLTALTRCFPGPSPSGKGDRAPSRAEIELCAAHRQAELALLRPAVILPVGMLAIAVLSGQARPLSATVGTAWERAGIRYLPLPHPSGVSRWQNEPANRARVEQALDRLAAWRVELDL